MAKFDTRSLRSNSDDDRKEFVQLLQVGEQSHEWLPPKIVRHERFDPNARRFQSEFLRPRKTQPESLRLVYVTSTIPHLPARLD